MKKSYFASSQHSIKNNKLTPIWRWMACVAQVRHRQLTHVAVSRRQLVLLINVQSLELVVVVLMLVDVICPPVKDPTVWESLGLKVGKYCKNAYLLHHMERRCHYRYRVGPSKRHRRAIIYSWHENTAALVVPRLILKIDLMFISTINT